MQAIMLAAGKGSRLGKYTKNNTKCMLDVHGETLLERAIDALLEAGIKDFILVLGYKKDNVKKFIKEKELDKKINITYVDNDMYDTTNNIYSLYLAKDYLIQDDTILLESDLIYDSKNGR
jgi:choline kinase